MLGLLAVPVGNWLRVQMLEHFEWGWSMPSARDTQGETSGNRSA